MIVCCCKAICSRKIGELIASGVDTVEAIGEVCGAGTDCGSCRTQIEEMIEDEQAQPRTLARARSLRVVAADAF